MSKATTVRRVDLLRAAIEGYSEAYKELVAGWRALDSKAQATASLSGIFLAAIFAFLRQMELSGAHTQVSFIAFAMIFLLLSVVFEVLSIRVRYVAKPPLGIALHELTRDALEEPRSIDQEERTHDTVAITGDDDIGAEGIQEVSDVSRDASTDKAHPDMSAGNIDDELYERFLQDQLRLWREVVSEVSKKKDQKAEDVQISQLLLAAAIGCVAVVASLLLFGNGDGSEM